jgi:hypothetical protein
VRLGEQFNAIENSLDPSWGVAQLVLVVTDNARIDRAAALLGPSGPGRHGNTIRFFTARRGAGVGPEAVRSLLRRLDEEGIEGSLQLTSSGATPSAVEIPIVRRTLADAWDAELATLPADWSDLYCELVLTSTDHLERTALLAAPLNPLLVDGTIGYRFRCARRFGYGASPGMVRRCFDRLDAEGVPGRVTVIRALSDTYPVATQGPVWYVGGRTV